MVDLPRGIRACNPGNIRLCESSWQGEIPGSDPDFVTFGDMTHGIRAAAKIFINYSKLDGLSTIAQYIDRWAPPSDSNPTSAYADYVATACAVDPNNIYNVEDSGNLAKLLDAVFQFENGGRYVTEAQITAGVDAALNLPLDPSSPENPPTA